MSMCQVCGIEADTKYVEFYQNIGALVMRFHKSVKGNLCKRCIHKYFWSYTGTNLTLGWWGTISLFVAPIFTINNIVRYVGCVGLKAPEANAGPVQITPDVAGRLQPFTAQILSRINTGQPRERVTREIAQMAGVTPGQVAMMIRVLEARRAQLQAQYQRH